jgi:hypothetical protein
MWGFGNGQNLTSSLNIRFMNKQQLELLLGKAHVSHKGIIFDDAQDKTDEVNIKMAIY